MTTAPITLTFMFAIAAFLGFTAALIRDQRHDEGRDAPPRAIWARGPLTAFWLWGSSSFRNCARGRASDLVERVVIPIRVG